MTDRHSGYVVVLDKDVREDDAQPIIAAIKQIRGVADVVPNVTNTGELIMSVRRDGHWFDGLVKAIETIRTT